MNLSFLKYLSLGFELFNAVTTLIATFKNPSTLDSAAVQAVVDPVLAEVASLTSVKIDPVLANRLIADAVDTLKAALGKS